MFKCNPEIKEHGKEYKYEYRYDEHCDSQVTTDTKTSTFTSNLIAQFEENCKNKRSCSIEMDY